MIYHRPTYKLDAICSICGKAFLRVSRRMVQASEETCSGNCAYIAYKTIPGLAPSGGSEHGA